jgi:hypothetical protein
MVPKPFRYVVHFGLVTPGHRNEGNTLDFGTDVLRAAMFAAELAEAKTPNLSIHLVKEIGFADRARVDPITLFLVEGV